MVGRKPSKTNLSDERPELTIAGIRAVAPGKQLISILFFIDSLTIKKPGSEIDGVPASDINETAFPSRIWLICFWTVLCSLKEWN